MLNNNIRDIRLDIGMTQKELAEKIKISTTALSFIETGKSRPRYITMTKIAKALNKQLDEVFYIQEEVI